MKTKFGRIGAMILIILISMSIWSISPASTNLEDTTPPEFRDSYPDRHVRNSTFIIHGGIYDESGIQKLTVNGEEVSGSRIGVWFFWKKTLNLSIGVNEITLIAYDDSPNHNTATKSFEFTYLPDEYQGPSVRIISVESMPSNNATIRCIINPNGNPASVYLHYGEMYQDHAPFVHGRGSFPIYDGTEDILVEYPLLRDEKPNVGSRIRYLFLVSNQNGQAQSELGIFNVTEPIDVPPESDILPPEMRYNPGSVKTPNPSILINGRAFDENGIKNVTVNGEKATGYFKDEWSFWQKEITLKEGENDILVVAYDNSPNQNSINKTSTVNYQISDYKGPSIKTMPVSTLPINNAVIQCIINPNGIDYTRVYLWYGVSSLNHTPFNHGRSLGYNYSGSEEILISYSFDEEWLNIGDTISYLFYVENYEGYNSTGVQTFLVGPTEIIQEDLILEGNEILIIEDCVYTHSGNIIVRDNASLILRNATLALYAPSFMQYDISFEDSSYFESFNSTITDTPSSCKEGGYYLFMKDSSFANITSTRFHYPATLLDARGQDVTVKILDSHLDYINIGSDSNVEINNSQAHVHIWSGSPNVTIRDSKNIDQILIRFFGSAYAELSLKPGHHSYWSLQENETVYDCDIEVTIFNSTISSWSLHSYNQPDINVRDSILSTVRGRDEASFNLENVTVTGRISSEDNSSITLRDSTINRMNAHDSSKVEMINTSVYSYDQVNVFNESEIYVGWHLDVTAINEEGPIESALVEVYTMPEANLVDGKLTDEEGKVRFDLWEKILRANGTDFINTYDIVCEYQGTGLSEEILLTGNYELEINFESTQCYVIPLFVGWNLIGLPRTPEDSSIEVVLSEIIDYVESVWAFDGYLKTWSSYSPGAPSDLSEMRDGRGYWINVNADTILTIYGDSE